MGLISPGGENLLDFLELRHVLSTYDAAGLDNASWFFRSQTAGSWALQCYSFRVWTPPLSEGQRRLSQE